MWGVLYSLLRTHCVLFYLYNYHGPLTRYAKSRIVHAPGMPGTFFPPPTARKPPISDPDMNHGTCVTHVPWCMSGSLHRDGGENDPGIPGACATRNFKYMARGPCRVILGMGSANERPIMHQSQGDPRSLSLSLSIYIYIYIYISVNHRAKKNIRLEAMSHTTLTVLLPPGQDCLAAHFVIHSTLPVCVVVSNCHTSLSQQHQSLYMTCGNLRGNFT